MPITEHVVHAHSSVVTNGTPKLPSSDRIEYGELAVNYAQDYETISLKNTNGDIVTFSSDKKVEGIIRENELVTASALNTVNKKIDDISTETIGDMSNYWGNSGVTNANNVVEGLNYNAQWVGMFYTLKPVVLYQTDGTTGLLGVNSSSFENNWQLTNLDLTPYSYIKCYFKTADLSATHADNTPSVVVIIPLDAACLSRDSSGGGYYWGSTSALCCANNNKHYDISCIVDSTKTKFQIVYQVSNYGTVAVNRNNQGRYLYKITGHYD